MHGLLLVDNGDFVGARGKAEDGVSVADFACTIGVADTCCHVFGDGLAFCLSEHTHCGQEHFVGHLGGVDTFLFEDDRNTHRLELTDVNQSIHGVSGEAGDGLGDDDIDFALFTELNHLFEVLTLLSGSACDTLIGEDVYEPPFSIHIDFVTVVAALGIVAVELLVFIG